MALRQHTTVSIDHPPGGWFDQTDLLNLSDMLNEWLDANALLGRTPRIRIAADESDGLLTLYFLLGEESKETP